MRWRDEEAPDDEEVKALRTHALSRQGGLLPLGTAQPGSGLYDVHDNRIRKGDLILHHFTYGIVTAIRPTGGHNHTGGLSYRKHDGSIAVCHNCRNCLVLMPGFSPFPVLVPHLSSAEAELALLRAAADIHRILEWGTLEHRRGGPQSRLRFPLKPEQRTALEREAVRIDAHLECARTKRPLKAP